MPRQTRFFPDSHTAVTVFELRIAPEQLQPIREIVEEQEEFQNWAIRVALFSVARLWTRRTLLKINKIYGCKLY
jgi:hypothetical protein